MAFYYFVNISQMARDRANISIAIRQEVRYLPSNNATSNAQHREFDLYFEGYTIFWYHIIFNIWKTVRANTRMPKCDFYRGWYCPSNSAIASDIHRELDLYFLGHKISGNKFINIWKTVRDSKECPNTTTFIEVDISHRIASMWMLYTMTLTYIFN